MKVSQKKMKSTVDTGDIHEMFNQMLGTGNVNVQIAYPKYLRLQSGLSAFVALARILADISFMQGADLLGNAIELKDFVVNSEYTLSELFQFKLDRDPALFEPSESEKTTFTRIYNEIKGHSITKQAITICNELALYAKQLRAEKPTSQFIDNMVGFEWRPLAAISSLNVKYLFTNKPLSVRTFMLMLLNKLFQKTYDIYIEIQSPDIDIKQFVSVIMDNIKTIQKRPELSRCRHAFRKIEESVRLLETNFDKYYRDFVMTSDSTIIMQNFVIDVSNNTKTDARTTAEFSRIIMFYRKMSAESHNTDPRVTALFDQLSSQFEKAGREDGGNVNITMPDDSSESDDAEEDISSHPNYSVGQITIRELQ